MGNFVITQLSDVYFPLIALHWLFQFPPRSPFIEPDQKYLSNSFSFQLIRNQRIIISRPAVSCETEMIRNAMIIIGSKLILRHRFAEIQGGLLQGLF